MLFSYIDAGSAPAFDADYQAVLTYATSQGWTLPSSGQQTLQNTLMLGLKSSGAWAKTDIVYVTATDGDANYASINWKSPGSFTFTRFNSPTFTSSRGFSSNGTTSYINTGFTPSINATYHLQDDAGRFIWVYSTNVSVALTDSVIDGVNGNNANALFLYDTGAQRINQGTTASLNANADMSGAGWRAINRTSSTNVELFSDTTQLSRTATSVANSSTTQTILRRGSGNYNMDSSIVSFYAMGGGAVSENTAYRAAVAAYIGAI